MLALKAEGKTIGGTARVDVFAVPLGDRAKITLAVLAARLRAAGVRVDLSYGDRGIKGAMRAADRSGASIALVAGDRDIGMRLSRPFTPNGAVAIEPRDGRRGGSERRVLR